MRADKRSDGEIIADIINLVDYPPVRVLVERRIDDLRRMLPPFTGNQKENREYAKGLREQIIELQRTLENRQSFLLKARFWQLWYEQGTAFEINPQTRDYIAQEPAPLTKELSWLRALCDEIIKFEPESTATQNTNRMLLPLPAPKSWKQSPSMPGENSDCISRLPASSSKSLGCSTRPLQVNKTQISSEPVRHSKLT